MVNLVEWDKGYNPAEAEIACSSEGGPIPLLGWADPIPKVDDWECPPEANLMRSIDKAIIIPVSNFYGIIDPNNSLNIFNVSLKRCYNKPKVRDHITQYLNYFMYFYDPEGELYTMYAKLKYMIDIAPEYSEEDFIRDVKKYLLLNKSLLVKIYLMNENNYTIELKAKKGRSIPSLQYKTVHGKIMMQMSLLQNIVIPVVCHFAYEKNIENVDELLLKVYDIILYMSDVDIFSKFYETSSSEVGRSNKLHKPLWDMQPIRGINAVTHTNESILNILLNIMPKYVYNENIISFNCTGIRNNNNFKVTGISYEFNFTMLSSSNRDADCQSDFDKYESYLITQNEALFLQNQVNAEQSLINIEDIYGPFKEEDIEYFMKKLEGETLDRDSAFNKFQKNMIFNLFCKYFGDPKSIYNINIIGYIKLMMAAKIMLFSSRMVVLPYVISSKVIKMPNKKAISKKYMTLITSDNLWVQIQEKYDHDEIVLKDILDNIGIAISSEYMIIAPDEPDLDGRIINYDNGLLIAKEYMELVLMI